MSPHHIIMEPEELQKEIEIVMDFMKDRGICPIKAFFILKFTAGALKSHLGIKDETVDVIEEEMH